MTAGSIIASIFVSGAGYVLFSFGRKQHRLPQMVSGVTLMIFPYFVTDVALMLAIAVGVGLLLWGLLRMGV